MADYTYNIQMFPSSTGGVDPPVIRIRADKMIEVTSNCFKFMIGDLVVGKLNGPIKAWWMDRGVV